MPTHLSRRKDRFLKVRKISRALARIADGTETTSYDERTMFEATELGIHPRQGPHCKIVDWNRDDFLDAVCFFKDKPRHWKIGETTGTLTGELFDGSAIEGSDSIRVVSKYKKAHRRHRKTN